MKHRAIFRPPAVILLFLVLLAFEGCSKGASSDKTETFMPGKTQVLKPLADGRETIGGEPLLLDISHTDQGYFTGILKGEGKKVNIQVLGPDQITYKYFIEETDTLTVFPLTAGNGSYTILAFENISGDQYASLFAQNIQVELEDEFLPFLYPNQFVNFSQDSQAVTLAADLSKDCKTDLDALTAVYHYVTETITYDNLKASQVSGNYLPDVDETLATRTGICFDYASLTAAMLRALGIPAKLEIGYSSSIRHAWVDVYIESMGWVEHAVEFNGDEWKLMDPTFSSTSVDQESISQYVGDGENYILEYVR